MPRPSLGPGLFSRTLLRSPSNLNPSSTTLSSLFRARSQCHPTNSLHRAHTHRLLTTITQTPHFQRQKKWPRRLWIIGCVLVFGYLGHSNELLKFPTSLILEPDSPEDLEVRDILREEFDQLDVVKKLRADPDYVEWEAYGNFTEEEKRKRLTTGTLNGARGVSTQRVFYNEKEKTATSVLHLGNCIDGWPTVVHGGALAIILDESMGRVALKTFSTGTGVTANLNINYKARVSPGQFVVIKVQYDPEKSSERKAVVNAVVEDEDGKLCTEASALFVEPKNMKLRRLGDGF